MLAKNNFKYITINVFERKVLRKLNRIFYADRISNGNLTCIINLFGKCELLMLKSFVDYSNYLSAYLELISLRFF